MASLSSLTPTSTSLSFLPSSIFISNSSKTLTNSKSKFKFNFLPNSSSHSHSTSLPLSSKLATLPPLSSTGDKIGGESTHRKVRFKTPKNPDSVLNFFRNNGFSDSQFHHIISKAPWLLSCNLNKRVLPKFQFFQSKGASNTDIVNIVTKRPHVLSASLKNQIIPTYELAYRFLQSDKEIIDCTIRNPYLLSDHRVAHNMRLLIENGVADSNITRLLKYRCRAFNTDDMLKVVEELKDLGFEPSKTTFGVALQAKKCVNKTRWKEKVDAFKKWGWSDEDVVRAFRKGPHCMLTSVDKINLVMSFWVKHLGWDALAIAKMPTVFGASLEKRLIPRAPVVQYLVKKGLRKKNASLTTPFVVNEKIFLDTCINRFKDESSYLLKLYEDKLNLANTRDKIGVS